MADISKITVNSTEYTLKDATARSNISNLAPKASPAFTGTPTAPTAAAGTNTTQIATTAFVNAAFQANDAMVFKGTIGSSGATVTALPNTHYQGWTYKVITAATYAGKVCEIGDMIICVADGTTAKDSDWTVVQSNVDGAVTGPASSTADHVATFSGTTGKVIKDSGYTIAKSVPSNAVFTDTDTKVTSSANHYSPATASGSNIAASASGATAAWSIDVVKGVTLNTDGKGHVTGMTVTSGKIPANPNTNTTYSLTQDATDGHKITLTPSSGTAQTITIPDNNTWRPVSDSVSSTSSSDAASSKAVKTAYDLANGKVSCTTANVKSALGTGSGTTKYLREDGSWATPAGTVPTYTYNSTTQVLSITY